MEEVVTLSADESAEASEFVVAQPARRCAAFVIDFAIFDATWTVWAKIFVRSGHVKGSPEAIAVWLGLLIVYYGLPTRRWGKTVGKMLLGLRVLNSETGSGVSWSSSLIRSGVMCAAFIVFASLNGVVPGLGWLAFAGPWIGVWRPPRRRALDDILARTVVVRAPRLGVP